MDLPTVRPLPDPAPIKTTAFTWKVLPPGTPGEARFGLTAKGYEALSASMADIRRWVEEAKWRLDYYRDQLRVGPTGGNR